MARLTVLDLLTPKPGKEDQLRRALIELANAEFSAAAPHGADCFTLRQESNGNRFFLEEQWQSRECFDEFHKAHRPPELLQFLEEAHELLAQPLDSSVTFWKAFETQVGSESLDPVGREIIEAVFDRISALDTTGLIALFVEHGRQLLPFAPEGFPNAFLGREELRRNYEILLAQYSSVNFVDLRISQIEEVGRWVATYRTRIVFRDGREYSNEYISLFQLEGNRLADWTEFFNPIVLQRELGNPFKDHNNSNSSASSKKPFHAGEHND